jgi:hypothetical protein
MISKLHDQDSILGDLVHEAMFHADAAGPTAFECVPELFGFARSLERRTLNFPYERIYTLQCFPILRLPEQIILPGSL